MVLLLKIFFLVMCICHRCAGPGEAEREGGGCGSRIRTLALYDSSEPCLAGPSVFLLHLKVTHLNAHREEPP